VFRIHGKGERALFSENWDASTKSVLLKYDNLRYRLMPYIYSLSWKVTHEAYTILRALAFDFRTDAAINDIRDQYMFGPAFMVNPVTEQMYSLTGSVPAEKTRKVYLPKAADWYDFWTGKNITGGRTIDAPAPIETLPLYIRAGSIIPMGPFLQYATEKPADPIELRIYTGADGAFTLYEDENDNYNYEKGAYSTIPIQWNESAKTLILGPRNGSFPGMLEKRTFRIVWVHDGHGTGLDPENNPDKIVLYDGSQMSVNQR
jgi:alpha-D-xyloside xylohydrolase